MIKAITYTLAILLPLAVPASILAAPKSEPKMGEVKTFKNWAVGCDNGYACQATSLQSQYGAIDGASVSISRGAGNHGQIKVRVLLHNADNARASLRIDGRKIFEDAVSLGEQSLEISGPRVIGLIRAMAKGGKMSVHGQNGALISNISLSGSSAAFRYMDDRQFRAGSRGAIVARGPKTRVAEVPDIPQIQGARMNMVTNLPTKAARETLIEQSLCKEERYGYNDDHVYSLGTANGKDHALVQIGCGSGAYNFSSVLYVASRPSGNNKAKWQYKLATFDYKPSWSDQGLPLLVNASFDEINGTIASYAKGRGIGDCGSSESYAWDGKKFRLYEATLMDECRGSVDWITIWRANIIPG